MSVSSVLVASLFPPVVSPAPGGHEGLLEPIPAVLGRRRGHTVDKSPVYRRASSKDKQPLVNHSLVGSAAGSFVCHSVLINNEDIFHDYRRVFECLLSWAWLPSFSGMFFINAKQHNDKHFTVLERITEIVITFEAWMNLSPEISVFIS